MSKRQNHKGTTDESKQTILRLDSPTDTELSPEDLEILNLFKAHAWNSLSVLDQLNKEIKALKEQKKHYNDSEDDESFGEVEGDSSDSEHEPLFDLDSETEDEYDLLVRSNSLIEIFPIQTAEHLILTDTDKASESRECCGAEGIITCPIL